MSSNHNANNAKVDMNGTTNSSGGSANNSNPTAN